MSNPDVVGVAPDQLEAGDRAAHTLAGYSQELQRIVRALQTDEGRRPRAPVGKEPQRRCGNDAKRSFRADNAQLVADQVAMDIIDGLEPVKVDDQDGHAQWQSSPVDSSIRVGSVSNCQC